MSSPTALVACLLAHSVQTVLHHAFGFQRKLPGVSIRHRSESECMSRPQTTSSLSLHHRHRPTMCYHDFAPSLASAPFLMLVRLRGTNCLKTFAKNLISHTFESFSKVIPLVLRSMFVNCIFTNILCNAPMALSQ